MNTASALANMVVINSSVTGIYMRAVRNCSISCVAVLNNNIGIEILDSWDNTIVIYLAWYLRISRNI